MLKPKKSPANWDKLVTRQSPLEREGRGAEVDQDWIQVLVSLLTSLETLGQCPNHRSSTMKCSNNAYILRWLWKLNENGKQPNTWHPKPSMWKVTVLDPTPSSATKGPLTLNKVSSGLTLLLSQGKR